MTIPTLSTPLPELDREHVERMVLECGAILLRNSSNSCSDFLLFSDSIGQEFVRQGTGEGRSRTIGGNSGRTIVDGIDSLFSTTGAGYVHPVPLHGELYFQQADPPAMLWFQCEVPPVSNGETLLCDGEALFAALPEKLQHQLADNRLAYHRQLDRSVWQSQFASTDADEVIAYCNSRGTQAWLAPDGSLRTRFCGPAIRYRAGRPVFINNLLPFALRELRTPQETRARVRMESGAQFPSESIECIERIASTFTHVLSWQKGDCVAVDNTRMLHGRNRVDGCRREIRVRMSNAGFISQALSGAPAEA